MTTAAASPLPKLSSDAAMAVAIRSVPATRLTSADDCTGAVVVGTPFGPLPRHCPCSRRSPRRSR